MKKRSWLSLVLSLLGLCAMCGVCIIPALPGYWVEQQQNKQRECHEGLRAVMNTFEQRRDAGVTLVGSGMRPGTKVGISPPMPKELVKKPELDRTPRIQFEVVPGDTGAPFTPILEGEAPSRVIRLRRP